MDIIVFGFINSTKEITESLRENSEVPGNIISVTAVVNKLLPGNDSVSVAVHAAEDGLNILHLDPWMSVCANKIVNGVRHLDKIMVITRVWNLQVRIRQEKN